MYRLRVCVFVLACACECECANDGNKVHRNSSSLHLNLSAKYCNINCTKRHSHTWLAASIEPITEIKYIIFFVSAKIRQPKKWFHKHLLNSLTCTVCARHFGETATDANIYFPSNEVESVYCVASTQPI